MPSTVIGDFQGVGLTTVLGTTTKENELSEET